MTDAETKINVFQWDCSWDASRMIEKQAALGIVGDELNVDNDEDEDSTDLTVMPFAKV